MQISFTKLTFKCLTLETDTLEKIINKQKQTDKETKQKKNHEENEQKKFHDEKPTKDTQRTMKKMFPQSATSKRNS